MAEQNEPKLEQNAATDEQRLAGIVAQTRADVGEDDEARVLSMLRQRTAEAGLEVSDAQLADLAAQVRSGDAGDFARKGR